MTLSKYDTNYTANDAAYRVDTDTLASVNYTYLLAAYNSTDFSISNYYTKTNIDGFNYYNSTDFSISDYTTSSDLFSWGYYNKIGRASCRERV